MVHPDWEAWHELQVAEHQEAEASLVHDGTEDCYCWTCLDAQATSTCKAGHVQYDPRGQYDYCRECEGLAAEAFAALWAKSQQVCEPGCSHPDPEEPEGEVDGPGAGWGIR